MQFQYGISKNSGIPFLQNPVFELTPDQQLFLYYLDFYHRFSELDKEERPSQEIMRNHFLCDEWVRIYLSKLDQKKAESKSYKPSSKSGKRETESYEF